MNDDSAITGATVALWGLGLTGEYAREGTVRPRTFVLLSALTLSAYLLAAATPRGALALLGLTLIGSVAYNGEALTRAVRRAATEG